MALRRGSDWGFTLVEVLVAFAILAFSTAALFPIFSDSIRASQTSEEYAVAVALAQARMAEYDVADEPGQIAVEGEYESKYRWRLETEPLATAEPAQETGLVPTEVSVTVEWGRSGSRSFTLSTVRLVRP